MKRPNVSTYHFAQLLCSQEGCISLHLKRLWTNISTLSILPSSLHSASLWVKIHRTLTHVCISARLDWQKLIALHLNEKKKSCNIWQVLKNYNACSSELKKVMPHIRDSAFNCTPRVRMNEITYFLLQADSITPPYSAKLWRAQLIFIFRRIKHVLTSFVKQGLTLLNWKQIQRKREPVRM